MATAANRRIPETLNVAFDYDTEPAIGDLVEITGSRHVQALTLEGRHKCVGEVTGVRSDLKEVTVATPFRRNIATDDPVRPRIAGETIVAGPFVFGVGNKVYQYSIATAPTHTGANASTFNIANGSADILGVKIGGGAVQSIDLTTGSTRTAAQIVAEINAVAVGFVASETAAHKLCLTGRAGQTMEITAESNTANTVLGLTAAVYVGLAASHDASLIAGMVVVGGAADAAVETLEY
jgi:hypothetical protein